MVCVWKICREFCSTFVSSLKERERVRESVGDLQTVLFNTCECTEIMCVRDFQTIIFNTHESRESRCLENNISFRGVNDVLPYIKIFLPDWNKIH
jgi:hypothetical protein